MPGFVVIGDPASMMFYLNNAVEVCVEKNTNQQE